MDLHLPTLPDYSEFRAPSFGPQPQPLQGPAPSLPNISSPRSPLPDRSRLRSMAIRDILDTEDEPQRPLQQQSQPSEPAWAAPIHLPPLRRLEELASHSSMTQPQGSPFQSMAHHCLCDGSGSLAPKRGPPSPDGSSSRTLKRARLTPRNLAEFLGAVGGRPEEAAEEEPQATFSTASTTVEQLGLYQVADSLMADSMSLSETSSTCSLDFRDLLERNGILTPPESLRPANQNQRRQRLNRRRSSPPPSEAEYLEWAAIMRCAPNDSTVKVETAAFMLKRQAEPGYHRAYDQPLISFPENVGFNNDLPPAQPGMIAGLGMPEFDPFPVLRDMESGTFFTGLDAITLPHIAGEWNAADMIMGHAQAAYDGACMVYARNEARTLLAQPDRAEHAFVSTFAVDGWFLSIFDHFSTITDSGQRLYHQSLLESSLIAGSYEAYELCRRRLRNLEDMARESSQALCLELRDHWLTNNPHPAPSACDDDFYRDDSDDHLVFSDDEDDNGDAYDLYRDDSNDHLLSNNDDLYRDDSRDHLLSNNDDLYRDDSQDHLLSNNDDLYRDDSNDHLLFKNGGAHCNDNDNNGNGYGNDRDEDDDDDDDDDDGPSNQLLGEYMMRFPETNPDNGGAGAEDSVMEMAS